MRSLATCALALAAAAAGCTSGATVDDDARADDADAAASVDAAPGPDAFPHACAPARSAGHQTIDCPEGVEADLEIPASCLAGGCPVVLDVHGYTMSADQQDQHTRMRALATARGYVVVQPSAPGVPATWGVGEHDDVVWALLEAVIDVLAIDPDRVHMTGFSQGGMMTYRQLCAHAEQLASVAPVAGGGCFAGQVPAVERPILYAHGHLDTVVPWATIAVPQRAAVLATWDFAAPATIASGSGWQATRWLTSAGTPFEMWEHDLTTGDAVLAGHCLPGPNDQGTFRCDNTAWDLSTVILDFFDAHPRGE